MINVFDLKPSRPVFRATIRSNANGVSAPNDIPNAPKSNSFDWNNLVSTLGDSISSIFGGLAGIKQAQLYQNQQNYDTRNTNSLLWIGILVVAVIVVAIILVSRKK